MKLLLSGSTINKKNVGHQYIHIRSDSTRGRTDKNGKKIFEGDIVIIDNSLKAVVIWFNGSFRFQDELSSKATSLDEMGVVMRNYDVQVIGNIHDNPELMK